MCLWPKIDPKTYRNVPRTLHPRSNERNTLKARENLATKGKHVRVVHLQAWHGEERDKSCPQLIPQGVVNVDTRFVLPCWASNTFRRCRHLEDILNTYLAIPPAADIVSVLATPSDDTNGAPTRRRPGDYWPGAVGSIPGAGAVGSASTKVARSR